MKITFKYIVIILLILFLFYYICNSVTEPLEQEEVLDQITFNADNFLRNLSEDEAKNMLVSNQIMPWVKFMEKDQADEIYNIIFENEENGNLLLKDLLRNILDPEIYTYIPENSSDLVGLFNKTKSVLRSKTIEEIEKYGEQFGFIKSDDGLILPSNVDLISNINKFLEDSENNFDENLLITHLESSVSIPSKNQDKPQNLDMDVNEINLSNFPNELKYRVRNNRDFVANSISNIINSIAFKKGLDWKKVNVGGQIILDTTVNPNNVFLFKKSKIIRLKNLNIDLINRPINILPIDFNDSKKKYVYNLLLNLSNKEYDSNDTVLNNNYTNYLGQVIWKEPNKNNLSEEMFKEKNLEYQNKIITILEHLKLENTFRLDLCKFIRRDTSDLTFLIHDPYPDPVNKPRKIFMKENVVIMEDKNYEEVEILKKEIDNGVIKYYVKDDDNWVNKSVTNQFTWRVPVLEELSKNLSGEERFFLIILNIVLAEILDLESIDLYYHMKDDDGNRLPLPIKYVDPYPLKWEGQSQRDYALNDLPDNINSEIIEFRRMKISTDGELEPSYNTGALQDIEVIVGRDDNILVKVMNVNGVKKYMDTNNIEYPNIDITEQTGKIGWKVNFLKEKFENEESNVIKKELTILNLLILAKGKAESARKNKLLPMGARNKVSLVIKNPPVNQSDILSENDKMRVYENIAKGLNDYNLAASGSSLDLTVEQIKNMNRLNLASLVENGIQRIERLLLSKKCLARESYPEGNVLKDSEFKDIKFFYDSDILRLQKALFGSFNKYVEPEDGLQDIIYASYRLKLILESKNDVTGNFLLERATEIDKLVIEKVINVINKIDYSNLNFSDKNEIQEKIINSGMNNENLSKVYEYINLDEYLSVKLDLVKESDIFEEAYEKIDENKKIIQKEICDLKKQNYYDSNLEEIVEEECDGKCSKKEVADKICDLKLKYECNVSDDELLEKYNYKNAINGINEVKSRLFSMTTEKKAIILDSLKENVINRQNITDELLKNRLDNFITLNLIFKDFKMLHFDSSKVIEDEIVEEFYNFDSYYKYDNYFKIN